MLFRDITILFSENCIKQMNKYFAENMEYLTITF